MSTPIRVRIAPSPTGTIHLGLARTALFNWAYARGRDGVFVLRMEDTDKTRSTTESEQAIKAGLGWLGIDWDEGPDVGGPYEPYLQSQRIERHKECAASLLAEGKAYRCFCSSERLGALREEQQRQKQNPAYDRLCEGLSAEEGERRAQAGEPFTVRFRVPAGTTRVEDLVRGDVSFANAEVDDWIMVRTDGNPTYNFVVVCDDADMRISHVFRGEEHLVNTPKQILLYEALGFETPAFGHLPLMLGKDKKKLSKRSGDVSLEDYIAKGYPKAAIINFLCLQGWALDGETEVFSVEQLLSRFDIKDVSKGGAIFDAEKFLWLAGEYVRSDSVAHLAACCAPYVVEAGLMTEAELAEREGWYHAVVAGFQERIRLYSELPGQIACLFAPDTELPWDAKAEKGARKHEARVEILEGFREWLRPRLTAGEDAAALREGARAWIQERELKFPQLFQPLRCALTGQAGGPDLFDVISWLGAESTLRRLECGIARLT